jgi:gpW
MYGGRFNPRTSIFAGLPRDLLQRQLEEAQRAYMELSSGAKVVAANYTQGDGSKSVTYTAASLPNIVALIRELQAQLGIIRRGRSPIRPVYI